MVEVLGYVPHEQAVSQMLSASLLLLAIPDAPDNKGIVTGKFFEYLAAKRPILAIGPLGGDVELMLEDCKAGKMFSYGDTENMQLYLLEIFEQVQGGTYLNQTNGTAKYTRRNLTRELTQSL